MQLANRAARTIRNVVLTQQRRADIPANQQVALQIFGKARRVTVVGPRKKTLPVVVFLTVLIIAVGLAFVLENMRRKVPRIASVPEFERSAPAASVPEFEEAAAADARGGDDAGQRRARLVSGGRARDTLHGVEHDPA